MLPRRWLLVALCVLMPLQWLSIANSPWFKRPPKPIGDGPDYENIAFHLWQGKGFVIDSTNAQWRQVYLPAAVDYAVHLDSAPRALPTTGRPPLFPLVIAGIYHCVGRNEFGFAAVRLFSATCLALAGALAVWLTAQLLARPEPLAPWGARVSILSLGTAATLFFAAINRTLRDYATDFLTEPLALLLMQCFVIVAIQLCASSGSKSGVEASCVNARNQTWLAGLAGVTWGALILTRSMFVVWMPAIWLVFFVALPHARPVRGRLATLVVLCACLTCLPWWIRNCVVLERFMPLGTQGPTTLLGGYSDAALNGTGDWQPEPERQLRQALAVRADYQALPSASAREVAVAAEASRQVRTWIGEHLWDLPRLLAKRIYVHWNPYSGASLLWKIPFVIGLLGLVFSRNKAAYWLIGLPLTSTLVVAGFYSTGGRFLVPLYGVLFTVAGMGVAMLPHYVTMLRPAKATAN
jgi:hypothetical protein